MNSRSHRSPGCPDSGRLCRLRSAAPDHQRRRGALKRLPAITCQQAIGLLVLALSLIPAVALAGEARVRVQDGLVSAVFDATPTPEAFEAVRRATGVAVLVATLGSGALTLAPDAHHHAVRALGKLHHEVIGTMRGLSPLPTVDAATPRSLPILF